jgi:hypothetical protein
VKICPSSFDLLATQPLSDALNYPAEVNRPESVAVAFPNKLDSIFINNGIIRLVISHYSQLEPRPVAMIQFSLFALIMRFGEELDRIDVFYGI